VQPGVCLQVTPKFREDGRIALAVDSRISSLAKSTVRLPSGEQAPVFDITMATTCEAIRDGQTWMFTQAHACACQEKVEQLPFLAYLPVLGRLMWLDELTPENSVYLVLVTPRVIAPHVVKDLFQIEARVCEGDPNGSREAGTLKMLANPTLVTRDGHAADFNVGGELAALTPEGAVQYVEFGTLVSVLARRVDDTWVHLDMKVEKTDRTDDPDPSMLKVAGHTSRTVGKFKLGEPVRMMLDKGDGKKLWCDVTVTVANP
jgi:Flp pilus assembly secretin CpaC